MATSSNTALARTIFEGKSTDSMAVQDAHAVTNGSAVNSLYDSMKGIYGNVVKGLYANKGSVRELATLIMDAKAGNVDKAAMFERALGALGTSLPSLLGQMGATMKDKLGSAAGTLIGPDAQKAVAVLYNNADLLIRTAEVDDLGDLVSLVGDLTGNSDLAGLVNIEAEAAVIAGIAKELMAFGIPELVDDVIQQARNEAAAKAAYQYLIDPAVQGSNLSMIGKIIDSIGLTMFLENNPNAITSILGTYYFGTDVDVSQYQAKRDELVNLLVRIDANWNKILRNGVYVDYLAPYMAASKDAQALLCYTAVADAPSRDRILTAAGRKTQAQAVSEVIKTLYPTAYIPSA